MRYYIAIDLKSFYASVACIDRGLDPMSTNLVVADESKTEKTICLAVTPSLKAIGVPGRPRLFEVVQQVSQANRDRLYRLPTKTFTGKSYHAPDLQRDSSLEIDYIVAPPQMARYMAVSTQIYEIYLRFIAPEDIHVYSVDEVFMDVTAYLETYHCTPRALAQRMIRAVLAETGITATAGIGTNLYLAKVAMDIVAKRMPPDQDGVRIAELDEISYRKMLWQHRPLTDFWRVGRGIAKRLESNHMYTMGDIAERSEYDEETLYRLFGINAELLIDHAWGYESCTIADIRSYQPKVQSVSRGQVLSCAYSYQKGQLIVREMTELLVLDLVEKGLLTNKIVLTVGYDHMGVPNDYNGIMTVDRYGKKLPMQAHGTLPLGKYTASTRKIVAAMMQLYAQIVDERLLVRRMYVVADRVVNRQNVPQENNLQLRLWDDVVEQQAQWERETQAEQEEAALQKAMLHIQHRYGKNAIIKGMNLLEGATTIERNSQIGGHKA